MKVQKRLIVTLDEIRALVAKAYSDRGLVGDATNLSYTENPQTLSQNLAQDPRTLRGEITFELIDRPTESEK